MRETFKKKRDMLGFDQFRVLKIYKEKGFPHMKILIWYIYIKGSLVIF